VRDQSQNDPSCPSCPSWTRDVTTRCVFRPSPRRCGKASKRRERRASAGRDPGRHRRTLGRALAVQIDKGWAGIHRCVTDGRLAFDNGEYPLRACVIGGEQLHAGDDFVVSLLTAEQVDEVASALASIDKASLRHRYEAIDPAEYGTPLSDDDFEYLWNCFAGLPEFFRRAASAGGAMVFTVDF